MRRTGIILWALVIGLALSGTVMTVRLLSQETAGGLYEAALLKKEASGDLQAAIQLFQKVLKQFPDKRDVAARAQFQIGACYEKLGTAEAIKAYELVLKNYSDQPELVAAARDRLAALQGEKASESATEKIIPDDIYLESLNQSPDGTKIAGIDYSLGKNVAIYDLLSKRVRLITDFTWAAGAGLADFPVISPDGKQIAYSVSFFDSEMKVRDAGELRVSTLEGTSRLLYREEHSAIIPYDWLPDGSAVLALVVAKDKAATLGLVSLKEGMFKALYTLQSAPVPQPDNTFSHSPALADLSPDGQYIAFHDGPKGGKRDIYVIPIDGQSPSVLSDHPADDKTPRWAPDGKHLVFLSDRHGNWGLWGMPVRAGAAGGPFVLLRKGMEDVTLFNWTKSGLAFISSIILRDIYTASIDPLTCDITENPKLVAFAPTGINSYPIWSPDGKYLAFQSFPWSKRDQGLIVLLPTSGGNARTYSWAPLLEKGKMLARLQWNVLGGFQWLPDSSGLGVIDLDKATGKPYLCELKIDSPEWNIRPVKAAGIWGQDGKTCFNLTQKGIVEYSLETGTERLVFPAEQDPKIMGRYDLAFSRDYSKAAWVNIGQKKPTTFFYQITIADLASGKTRVFEEDLQCPRWTPDGQHLLALGSRNMYGFPTALFVLGSKDGKIRKLDLGSSLPKGTEMTPHLVLSPDGKRLAFGTQMKKMENLLIRNVIPQELQGKRPG